MSVICNARGFAQDQARWAAVFPSTAGVASTPSVNSGSRRGPPLRAPPRAVRTNQTELATNGTTSGAAARGGTTSPSFNAADKRNIPPVRGCASPNRPPRFKPEHKATEGRSRICRAAIHTWPTLNATARIKPPRLNHHTGNREPRTGNWQLTAIRFAALSAARCASPVERECTRRAAPRRSSPRRQRRLAAHRLRAAFRAWSPRAACSRRRPGRR
jgi:hypothetical protein